MLEVFSLGGGDGFVNVQAARQVGDLAVGVGTPVAVDTGVGIYVGVCIGLGIGLGVGVGTEVAVGTEVGVFVGER